MSETNSTTQGNDQTTELSVSLRGIVGLGAYLVAFTLATVIVIWRVIPPCDVLGFVATRLVPSEALTAGGEQLRITGEGFKPGVTVRIGNTPPLEASVVSPFEIAVTTPKHAAGRVAVSVAHPAFPTIDVPGGLQYVDTRATAPVTSVTPTDVPATGGTPPGPLVISTVTPATAGVGGGDAITIMGSGFTAGTTVRFGGLPARAVRVDSPRFITAVTPMHAPGAVGILVASDQSVSTLEGGFSFVCPAAPDDVMVLLVLLAGALGGLVHALRSFFWYVGEKKLKWNWVPMYVLLPFASSALAFVFYLVIRAGLYSPTGGTSYLLVGLAALVGMFSAQAAEKLRKVAEGLFTDVRAGSDSATAASTGASTLTVKPTFGPPAGGNIVTITGTGFAKPLAVRFDTALSDQVALVDAKTLRVVVPARATGTVDVGVTVIGKQEVVKTGGYTYTNPKGKIVSINPAQGAAGGGTATMLKGEKFTKEVSVMFGHEPAAAVRFIDDTTIEATTPRQEHPGAVDVRVDAGSDLIGIASGGFTYTP